MEATRRFRDDRSLQELNGVRDTGGEKLFYLARPIQVALPCLPCHSTPDRAPAGMVAKYGPDNGFGWQLGETVGVQMLTVPLTQSLQGMTRLIALLAAGVMTVFAIAYLALSTAMDAMIARPLAELARAAERQSVAASPTLHLPRTGVREIRVLAAAIERLRTSLGQPGISVGSIRAAIIATSVAVTCLAVVFGGSWLILTFGTARPAGLAPTGLHRVVVHAAVALVVVDPVLNYFGLDVRALLATSAIVTGAIGFAMQPTLGSMIAGIGAQQRPHPAGR